MDYKQFVYVIWFLCTLYISYYHGTLASLTSNTMTDNQMENNIFVNNCFLDLILRGLFRLAVPAHMLYNMVYPPPRPDVELQNLHRD